MYQPPARKPKITAAQFAARFKAEKARQERRYCDAFALWRGCKVKRCQRERGCCGDTNECLKRAFACVPHRTQWQTRQDILAATPKNIGAPERAARQCMPIDFYLESAGKLAADYLARFKPISSTSPRLRGEVAARERGG